MNGKSRDMKRISQHLGRFANLRYIAESTRLVLYINEFTTKKYLGITIINIALYFCALFSWLNMDSLLKFTALVKFNIT